MKTHYQKLLQCKHISTIDILKFLDTKTEPCTIFNGFANSIVEAFPENTPEKINLI